MLSILTVTQLNTYVKSMIEENSLLQSIFIKGEITNFTKHTKSGHCYFCLKDERASVRAVMFQSHSKNLRFLPENGLQVIVQCSIGVYEKEGSYQLYVYDLQPDGIGSMNLAYEQKKEKLEKEGLFSSQHKKQIPCMPATIGVITSPTGAVIHDIINVLNRRYPIAKLLIFPVTVQGELASQEVCNGVAYFNNCKGCDVIIIARGGGSSQDLAPFNDEQMVREIFASEIPIISGVGHETDYTLCDFVSDIRASTPSIAAELVAPDIFEKQKNIMHIFTYLQCKLLEKNDRCRSHIHRTHSK
ncbi:MAG: exodeoxyribonuclease VII large subunit, partial [Oscillospiraceae bacterium]